MEEDGNKGEWSGNVGVKQGRKRRWRIEMEEKGRISGDFWGCCGRIKRATQIELKTEKECVIHTHTPRGSVGVDPGVPRDVRCVQVV